MQIAYKMTRGAYAPPLDAELGQELRELLDEAGTAPEARAEILTAVGRVESGGDR